MYVKSEVDACRNVNVMPGHTDRHRQMNSKIYIYDRDLV